MKNNNFLKNFSNRYYIETSSHIYVYVEIDTYDMPRGNFPREKAILKILRRHIDKGLYRYTQESSSPTLHLSSANTFLPEEIVFRRGIAKRR